VTPQTFVLGVWLMGGACNAVLTGVVLLAIPDDFEEKKKLLSTVHDHGTWPFAIALCFLMLVGPIGLAYTTYRLSGAAWLYCQAYAQNFVSAWKFDRATRRARKTHEALLLKTAMQAVERLRNSVFARCPSCSRLIELDASQSLPCFRLHDDLTMMGPCPSSGKNFVGPLIRGDSLGLRIGKVEER
jgi:hypothetical protein